MDGDGKMGQMCTSVLKYHLKLANLIRGNDFARLASIENACTELFIGKRSDVRLIILYYYA